VVVRSIVNARQRDLTSTLGPSPGGGGKRKKKARKEEIENLGKR